MGIGAIFTGLATLISSWFDIKKAKNENTARLLRDKESNNTAWEMASITHTPTGLRYISFAIIYLPIIVTIISPEYGAMIWVNMELVPEYWVTGSLMVLGSIWGFSEVKNMGFFKR
ncbi:hypothetical protein AB832_08230 [Flavobacteriaceae bacterium (ex Bugula neritina AB1)]|nr:hypothetical protein AB832_08230 [Flavobacteriaceae bacterium (ex Bugula neritina AB1)]